VLHIEFAGQNASGQMTPIADLLLSAIELPLPQRFAPAKKYSSLIHSLPTRCRNATDVAYSQRKLCGPGFA
jgi:hypothetical protein